MLIRSLYFNDYKSAVTKIKPNLFWNKKTNPFHDKMINYFSNKKHTELQQFKCKEYIMVQSAVP